MAKNYQETKCFRQIDALYSCCQKMYDHDSNAHSTACPKPDVVARKLREKRERDKGKK